MRLPTSITPQAARQALRLQDFAEPAWVLLYGDQTAPLSPVLSALRAAWPNAQTLGCTSFRGVFTHAGFQRGLALLIGEAADGIRLEAASSSYTDSTAKAAAHRVALELRARLDRAPSMLLLHTSPGSEEDVLEGIRAVFPEGVPVFGGSAADDTINGTWMIHCNGKVETQGLALAALCSESAITGGFIGGYLPSEHAGIITRVENRVIQEIDGRRAAEVYNRWTDGAIDNKLRTGGRVMSQTNLFPLARTIDSGQGLPRRLLSHPERVIADSGGLSCFSRFSVGDRVELMTNTTPGLMPRMRRAVERALAVRTASPPRGGLMVYCAGCLGATLDQASDVSQHFEAVAGNIPFVGVSTFGEQGSFFARSNNLHGNLMCSAVLLR